ncbi:hypothetical protein EON62_02380 [archaeon]|nr:MAG: hypothetical protein EON62_02380 [archaeon]
MQIVAVLAHEIGHWQMSHTVYGILLSFSMTLCVLFSFTYFMSWYAPLGTHSRVRVRTPWPHPPTVNGRASMLFVAGLPCTMPLGFPNSQRSWVCCSSHRWR